MDIHQLQNLVETGDYIGTLNELNAEGDELSLEKLVIKTQILRELGYVPAALDTANYLIEKSHKQNSPYYEYLGMFEKGYCVWRNNDYEQTIQVIQFVKDNLDGSSGLSDVEKLELFAKISHVEANYYWSLGEIEKSLAIHRENESKFIDLKDKKFVSLVLNNIGVLYTHQGLLNNALSYLEQSLLFNVNYKMDRARTYNNLGIAYRIKRNYENADENLKRSLRLQNKYFPTNYAEKSSTLFELILLKLQHHKISDTKKYFHELDQISAKTESEIVSIRRQLSLAMINKESNRLRDKFEAQLILEKIISSDVIRMDYTHIAMFLLYDLLLEELKLSGEEEIYTELVELVKTIRRASETQKSVSLLAESYLLEAKNCLLFLDIEESRNLLSQALVLCEDNQLRGLEVKINLFFDDLILVEDQLDPSNPEKISLQDRIDKSKMGSSVFDFDNPNVRYQLINHEVPIMALVISRGGNLISSKSFTELGDVNEHLVGSFLSAVNSFTSETFKTGGNLEILKVGTHTILLHYIGQVILVYIFKGNSHHARTKIKEWGMDLNRSEELQEILNNRGILRLQRSVLSQIEKSATDAFEQQVLVND